MIDFLAPKSTFSYINPMKYFKIYLLLILFLTVLFLTLGMYGEINSYYKHRSLLEIYGPRIRHTNANFYTGFYIMSLMLTTLHYLFFVGIRYIKTIIGSSSRN